MSIFESIDNVKYQISRFLWPTIFFVSGILLLRMAMIPVEHELNNGEILVVKQDSLFLYGALFFIVGSIIWYLYLFGVLNNLIGFVVMGVMGIASAYLLYQDYFVIKKDVDHIARYNMIDTDIKARMLDIKAAESAYKEFYKKYTGNMDTLIWFVKNGKKMTVPNIGKLPERRLTTEEIAYIYGDNRPADKLMTDQEANALAHSPNPPADLIGFSRDTVYRPVLEAIFYDQKYKDNRSKLDPSLDFHPDSLRYIPHTSLLVKLDTGSVSKGDFKVPTLQIQMIHPMDSLKIYQIGDLYDNHLRDNWSK